jgi:hypothetical protein
LGLPISDDEHWLGSTRTELSEHVRAADAPDIPRQRGEGCRRREAQEAKRILLMKQLYPVAGNPLRRCGI